jgi:hypothetical protein
MTYSYRKLIIEQIERLPQGEQFIYHTEWWMDELESIASEFSFTHMQIDALGIAVGELILKRARPEKFSKKLVSTLAVDIKTAQTIFSLLNERIFKYFRQEIAEYQQILQEAIDSDRQDRDITISTVPVKKVEVEIEVNEVRAKTQRQNPLLKKLNTNLSIPTKKSDGSHLPPSGYDGGDPYHEDV